MQETTGQDQLVSTLKAEMHKAAREYLTRGWNIIPISIADKKPLIKWKDYQSRRVTDAEVNEWFTRGVETESGSFVKVFNLAIVTGSISGVVIVDADNSEAKEFCSDNGLFSFWQVRTSRGAHYYWKHPGDGYYQNKVGGNANDWPDLKGLDFRGDGGYALLPPSVSFNQDGTLKHQYEWVVDDTLAWDELQTWRKTKATKSPAPDGEFSFGELDLSGVKVQTPQDFLSVWDQAQLWVFRQGRKMGNGDGRNSWLIRYAGERIAQGVIGDDLVLACESFCDHYFEDPLPRNEFIRTIQSAEEIDKRNHPDRYDADGTLKAAEGATPQPAKIKALRPLLASDMGRLKNYLKEDKYILDPILKPGTITQVVGYNGHGKSLFIGNMLYQVSLGRPFGPFQVDRPWRCMYFDFEMPAATMEHRISKWLSSYGDPGENFMTVSLNLPSTFEDFVEPFVLSTESGFAELGEWVKTWTPDVVVIDTIRNAFRGLDEFSPQSWAVVNHVAKTLRNMGCAVILVHHRNKPGEGGLGREAGSTAQLTDIDTQVMVTQVAKTKDEAKAIAGLADDDLEVTDMNGKVWTPWSYLENRLEPESRLVMVQQVSFGKVRQYTDNHTRQYVGFCEHYDTANEYITSTKSPRQKAMFYLSQGKTVGEISHLLKVPQIIVRQWLGLKDEA